ncbi:MAG: hypothetical protein JO063_15645 [Pseudonocardiales bacterium]|nr:hypothetical protein [Pseudonocardiales bacterium]MBW0011520.1 hypothetical protein [Pseudonocardiales bacterium]
MLGVEQTVIESVELEPDGRGGEVLVARVRPEAVRPEAVRPAADSAHHSPDGHENPPTGTSGEPAEAGVVRG